MPLRYTQTVVPGDAVVVFFTCSTSISSQFIGFAAAHTCLALDQSKSTMPHPTVDAGSVSPDSLQGMMIVLLLISHVTGYGQTDGIPFWEATGPDRSSNSTALRIMMCRTTAPSHERHSTAPPREKTPESKDLLKSQ
jgi:hypothetical protein